jgi:hypothetical protein
MFAEHDEDVLFTLFPGDALLGPEMFAPHSACAATMAAAINKMKTTCLIIDVVVFCFVV